MKVQVLCPCGRQYSVPSSHVGRKIQCKKCGRVLVVEAEEAEPAPFSMAFVSMEDTGLPEDQFNFDDDDYDDPMVPSNIGLLPSDSEVAQFVDPGTLSRKTDRAPVFQEPIPLPGDQRKKKSKKKRKKKRSSGSGRQRPPGDISLGIETPATEELLPNLTKTCPNCETVCTSEIRICISCGYDFERRQLISPKEAPEKRRGASANAAKNFSKSLESLSWMSLIPGLGLIVGPYTLIKSASASQFSQDLSLKGEQHFNASVNQARLVALLATLIWAGVAFFAFQIYVNQPNSTNKLNRRQQLRALAKAVRKAIQEDKVFPSSKRLPSDDAIAELGTHLPNTVSVDELQRNFEGKFEQQIQASTHSSQWLFWERIPHDENGEQIQFVVRFDRNLERIKADKFQSALKKAFEPRKTETKPTPTKKPDIKQKLAAFLKYFQLTQGKTDLAELEKAVKQPAIAFLGEHCLSEDLEVRKAIFECVINLQGIPVVDQKRLLTTIHNSGDNQDQLRVIGVLHKQKDQDWLRFAGKLYKDTANETIKAELHKLLLGQYMGDQTQLRALLNVAVDLRASADDRPMFIPPDEEVTRLIPHLSNPSYFNEIQAIFQLNNKTDLFTPLKKAIEDERELEIRLILLKTLINVSRHKPDAALKIASKVLSDNRITAERRLEMLDIIANIQDPLKIKLAAEQFALDRDELRKKVRSIFEQALNYPLFLPELIKTFDSEAASITKEAMRDRINDQLTESIALLAGQIDNKRGIEAILELINSRSDPGSLKILKTFYSNEDPVIESKVFRAIKAIKANPGDSQLIEFMGEIAASELRERGRNDKKVTFICSLLGEYQQSSNISVLKSFVIRTKSLTAANAAISALGKYNSLAAVKALVSLATNKRLKSAVRKKATVTVKRLAGVRSRSDDLENFVEDNREKIEKNLERKETNRLRRINR